MAEWKKLRDAYHPVHTTLLPTPPPAPLTGGSSHGGAWGALALDRLLFAASVAGGKETAGQQMTGPRASWRRSREMYSPAPTPKPSEDKDCCIVQ